jgi:tRNA threonylcarbamoyladenosine biosynthesis protein TsaE
VSWRRYCVDAEATKRAGESFARVLHPGDIVLLTGQLGAGKTTFTQGVGRGLGVSDRITSPTFTMVRQHDSVNDLGITTLHHADVYRIDRLDEVIDLALGELVEESAVALVEWGDIATAVFGRDVMTVTFLLDDDARTLVVDGELTDGRHDALDAWAVA